MAVVVDTNVAVVASRLGTGADDLCVNRCIARLFTIQQQGGLLVDDRGLILSEYTKKLGHSGQPGVGHFFVKWAHDHQAIPEKVRQVTITPRHGDGWRRFEEFPDQQGLSTFHKKDQKFVAVAIASGDTPPILNAVDSDWWNHSAALNSAGVIVECLCPQHAPEDAPR
ncbi:MAG: hypothetical protein KIS87_06350 [Phycisphaeraceae bacterium]|nr:hypothetical protein [Phycisphaeraceae bacterium]